MMDDVKNFYENLEKNKFDQEQLKQIYLGLESLCLEDVKIYACEYYDAGQMQEIRLGLETLPVSLVSKYANPDNSRELMAYRRLVMQRDYFKKMIDRDIDYYYDFQIVQILMAIKTLPLEIALSIADPKLSSFELEQKRKELEENYFKQMISKNSISEFSCTCENIDELMEIKKIKCIKK